MGKALNAMLQTEGVVGLWRGLGPTVFRDVPFSGVYWAIYESLKVHNNVTVPTFWFSFFGGAVSGSVSPIFISLKILLPNIFLFLSGGCIYNGSIRCCQNT